MLQACEALGLIWAVHVHNEGASSTEKQDDLLYLVGRGIDFAMDGMRGNVEEISSTDGDDILSSSATLEASRSGNEIAIDVVVSVVMPTGDCPRVGSPAKYQLPFVFEGKVPSNPRT
jgi:hypothetical protein